MTLVRRQQLIDQLSPPADSTLATQLVDEFISLERRYIQRDWEPAELDGGQFCEILMRILYHLDSGNLNLRKSCDECITYINNNQAPHAIKPRSDAIHLAKVAQTVYKFRSDRGAVHISPHYTPNHMDAKLVIECVRWAMAEILRLISKADRDEIAKSIRELLQFDVPCIGTFENVLLVQRTDLTAEEELLVLLHYAGEAGFSRRELGLHARRPPATITTALGRLTSPEVREVVQLPDGRYRLTDLGSKRVREQLTDKLLLG